MGIGELAHSVTSGEMVSSRRAGVNYLVVKRVLDLVLSALGLLILFPVLLVISIAVKIDSPGPIIFRQERVRGGQDPADRHVQKNVFWFLKFRSMRVDADPRVHQAYVQHYINGDGHKVNNGTSQKPLFKMKDDPRVTHVGRFLRKTSLDELPQLINVLRGDMSLVGPRPALPYEVENYDRRDLQRLAPQAGLTGLWQVSGRTTLTFKEMIELDVEYAQRRSLRLDVEILLKTLPAVVSREGAW